MLAASSAACCENAGERLAIAHDFVGAVIMRGTKIPDTTG